MNLKDQKSEVFKHETFIWIEGNFSIYGSELNKSICGGSGMFSLYAVQVGFIKITAMGGGVYGYLDLVVKESILVIDEVTPEVINN